MILKKFLYQLLKFCTFCLSIIFITVTILNFTSITIKENLITGFVKQKYGIELITSGPTLFFQGHRLVIKLSEIKLADPTKNVLVKDLTIFANIFNLKIKANGQVIKTNLADLSGFIVNQKWLSYFNDLFSKNKLIIDGNFKFKSKFNVLEHLVLEINSSSGYHIAPAEYNLANLFLKNFEAKITFKQEVLNFEKLNFEFLPNIKLNLSGTINFTSDNQFKSTNLHTESENLPIKYFHSLWPNFLYPDVKQWVVGSVKNGVIQNSAIDFNFTEQDFVNSNIGKDSIGGSIQLKDFELNFSDNFKPVKDASCNILLDGEKLKFVANDLNYDQEKIPNIEVDLTFADLMLGLNLKLSNEVKIFKQFIPQKISQILKRVKLDLDNLNGKIDGVLNLTLPLNRQITDKDIDFSLTGLIKNLSFANSYINTISNAPIKIVKNQQVFTLKLNDDQKKLIDIYYDVNNPLKSKFYFDFLVLLNKKIFQYSQFKLKEGIVAVNLSIIENRWDLNLDLTNSNFFLGFLTYNKNNKQKFLLNCNGTHDESLINAKSCQINANDSSGNFGFIINKNFDKLINLSLRKFRLGNNEFEFSMESNANKVLYKLSGEKIDITNLDKKSLFSRNVEQQDFVFESKLNKIFFNKDIVLDKVYFKIEKKHNMLVDLESTGLINGKSFNLNKIIENNYHYFRLIADDAASLFQLIGYNKIKRGKLMIDIAQNSKNNPMIYHGFITIADFALSDTSALTKIVLGIMSPLNSPQAFFQSLKGGSFKVDLMQTEWFFDQEDTFFMHNCNLKGPSYQIYLDGNLNLNSQKVDFTGNFVPSAYGINTLVASIPVFGDVLSGGKKSGLISSNFKIKGLLDEPQISFNPISIIIPGFIKKVFN